MDYWSLGICVFELLFGRRPFESRSADKLTHAITKGSIKFPAGGDDQCSKEGQNLVLLVGVVSLSFLDGDDLSRSHTLISITAPGSESEDEDSVSQSRTRDGRL